MEKIKLFDWISNVMEGKLGKDLMADVAAEPGSSLPDCVSKSYTNFMVNRAMSQHEDTIFVAAELNRFGNLPKKMHYDFSRSLIRGRKRYGKWAKAQDESPLLDLVKQHYKCNSTRAEEALELMSQTQKEELQQLYDKGGK